MRTFTLLFLLAALACGCSLPAYQVTTVQYTGSRQGEQPHIIDHGHLRIHYNLWHQGGHFQFELYNQTSQPLTLDLRKSSLIVNGQAFPYFDGEAYTDFSSEGTELAISTYTTGSAYTRFDQPRLTIPPNAFVSVRKFDLRYPVKDMPPVNSANESRSLPLSTEEPFTFRNYLTYSLEDEPGQFYTIQDPFTVIGTQLMGEMAFSKAKQQLDDPLRFYHVRNSEEEENKACWGVGTSIGLSLLLIGIVALPQMEFE